MRHIGDVGPFVAGPVPDGVEHLELCDRLVREVAGTAPLPFPVEEPAGDGDEFDEFAVSLGDYYGEDTELNDLPGLDDHLRLAFHDAATDPDRPA